jgi:hypothetical protein
LEQVLELATDGQEAEALHHSIFTIKTALMLAVLLTPHVQPERVAHALLVHALDVRLVHVAVAVVLTHGKPGCLKHFLVDAYLQQVQMEQTVDTIV